jgi:hypothetical protein
MTKVKKPSQKKPSQKNKLSRPLSRPARGQVGRGLKKKSRNLGPLVPRKPKTPTTCVQTSGKKMRKVASVVHPSTTAFGFDVSENLSIVSTERGILSNTSSLLNTITGSDCSWPNYKHPSFLFKLRFITRK